MVGDVDHCQENAKVVFALEITDSCVDVLRMKTMILETVGLSVRIFILRIAWKRTSETERMCPTPKHSRPEYHCTPTA